MYAAVGIYLAIGFVLAAVEAQYSAEVEGEVSMLAVVMPILWPLVLVSLVLE